MIFAANVVGNSDEVFAMIARRGDTSLSAHRFLDLLDFRQQVDEMYGAVRSSREAAEQTWSSYRKRREQLFKTHPQSALSAEQKSVFEALPYYPYNPELRLSLPLEPLSDETIFEMELEGDGLLRYRRLARIHFAVEGRATALTLYWMLGYGGGVFLPFRDLTNQTETFGGGRYLIDTIKNVDLGQHEGRWLIDFNYAYNPSCAYNSRWHCPLPPSENWLAVPIRAGEQRYPAAA